MEQDLNKFYEKVNILNKEFSIYKDEEKGILIPFNTVHLLARVDYLELDAEQYKIALFQNKIEEKNYKTIKIKRAIPKYEITKKEEDKTVIIEKDVEVKQIWNISNTLGAFNTFTDKDRAIKAAEEINNKITKYLV
mgnify:CR=1 FL=1